MTPAIGPGRRDLLILLPVVLLYLAGLNGSFLPDQYDNILYYVGARSLVADGAYHFMGEPIGRWPPLFPLLLTPLFVLGVASAWTAKLIVVATVGASLWLGRLLLRAEGRPRAILVLWLAALLPQSYLMGTRVMAEWPYTAASLLFLYLLARLRTRRRLPFAVAVGVALGAATLSRWVGLFLGAAVLYQAAEQLRAQRQLPRWRRVVPEAVAGAVGAGLTLLWVLTRRLGVEAVADRQPPQSVPIPVQFDVLQVPAKLADMTVNLLFQVRPVLDHLGGLPAPLTALLWLPALFVLLGFGLRWHARRLRAADLYVAVSLAYLGSVYLWEYRYLVPVAPFLVDYFLTGAAWSLRRLRLGPAVGRGLVLLWAALLLSLDGYLLLRGTGAHAGLAPWVSPSPESFYRGPWLDLYLTCRPLRDELPPGAVAVVGDGHRYPHIFSGRPCRGYAPGVEAPYVLVAGAAPPPLPGYREVARHGTHILYARD